MTTQRAVGSVVSLWRYPVKSMMGEELNATEVAKMGLLGDRSYALVNSSDAKVASAKNPRKWPQLFDFRAALADAPRTVVQVPSVRITLPDGTLVTSDQPNVDRILSNVLKHQVKLESALAEQRTTTAEEYWPGDGGGCRHALYCLACFGQSAFPQQQGKRGASGPLRTAIKLPFESRWLKRKGPVPDFGE
jgi:hypothetical protein